MLAGLERLRYPFTVLAVRQTDVHGVNTFVGDEVVICCMNSYRFKSRRPLLVAAGDGIERCSAR
jgi:hypothetical protein